MQTIHKMKTKLKRKKHFRRCKKKGTLSFAQDFLFPAQLLSSAPQTSLGSYAMLRTPSSFCRGRKPAIAEPRPAPWSSCDALQGRMPVLRHNVTRGYSLCLFHCCICCTNPELGTQHILTHCMMCISKLPEILYAFFFFNLVLREIFNTVLFP